MSEPDPRDPRLDGAYRETPRDEPPPALDEGIRAAARRAVGARPESPTERSRRSWTTRWRVPLSVAATVLVAVTVSFMMQDEEARKARIDMPMDAPGPRSPAPSSSDAEAKRSQPATAAPEALGKREAPGATRAVAPSSPPRPVESPAPASSSLERRANEPVGRADEGSAPAAPPAQEALPSAPGAPAAAPRPAPMREERLRIAPDTEGAAGLSRDRQLADRPVGATRESAPARAPAAVATPPRSPETWIEDIRRLRAQGRDAEAAAELAEFRRRHPDFALPADLAR